MGEEKGKHGAPDKRLTHGVRYLKRTPPSKWPASYRRAYDAMVTDLLAQDGMDPKRHAPLCQLIAMTSLVVEAGMSHGAREGFIKGGELLPVFKGLGTYVNTLSRLLQVAGLTPLAGDKVLRKARASGLIEMLAEHADAEVEQDGEAA